MKTISIKLILASIFLLGLAGCSKEQRSLIIHFYNPYNIPVDIGVNSILQVNDLGSNQTISHTITEDEIEDGIYLSVFGVHLPGNQTIEQRDPNSPYYGNGIYTPFLLEFGKEYTWTVGEGQVHEKPSSSGSNNPLNGKWVQVNACTNSAGGKNYFNFSSSTSGEIGQIDCNNTCSDGGVYTQFDYTTSGSNVSITPKSVSDFCGTSPTLASPFTVPFSISGNILTLDGENFEK